AVIHPGFDPAEIARDHGANVVSLVPTMLRRLLRAGVDLRRFRWILLGGGSVPPDLVAEAARAGARVVTTYGMTETCGGAVYDGVPLPGVRVAVGDGGETALAGPGPMAGHRLRPRPAPALPELRAFVAARLAPHKAPRVLVVVPELPRGPTGKPIDLDALPW